MKRFVCACVVLLIVLGASVTPLGIPVASASGTIYIRGDGSVDPASAPIERRDSNVYVFTDHIAESLVVERSNLLIDGDDYTLSGSGVGNGIAAQARSHIVIFNLTIHGFDRGIALSDCTDSTILNTTVTANGDGGIHLASSSHNIIYGNAIIDNPEEGIQLAEGSHSNTIHGNTISGSLDSGLDLYSTATNNQVYHNNFIDNAEHVEDSAGTSNTWDAGYPSGGNYWSDYTGDDSLSGPYQDTGGPDGLGDTPYVIDADNQDHYPLMDPYTDVPITYPGPLVPTSLSCSTPKPSYCESENVSIHGGIMPQLEGIVITLTYINVPERDYGVIHTVTTDAQGAYTDSFRLGTQYAEDTLWEVYASWDGDATYHGAVSSTTQLTVREPDLFGFCLPTCFIATATYGSAVAPEVQFLRAFRADTVLTTFTGQQFMTVFNTIYYAFSPTVASSIARSEGLRTVMRGVLFPLIRVLQVGEWVTLGFTFNAELGIVAFCLVVSALLSLVYLVPWALLLSYWKRRVISGTIVRRGRYLLMGSLGLLLLAIAARVPAVTMAGGALTVLVVTGLTTIAATRAIMRRLITP